MNNILGELGEMEDIASSFLSSLEADRWLFEPDIAVGKSHVLVLIEEDIIPKQAGREILRGLEEIDYSEIEGEDVHVAIESELEKKIGKRKSGWLHTARSRNDEVATCIRLRVRDEIKKIMDEIISLIETILAKSEQYLDNLFPGYTHHQHAEPTKISHHLLSYSQAFIRDLDRLIEAYNHTNKSPLGAGALTTTTHPIDREKTAKYLGFNEVLENSIDAVNSRDYLIETTSTFLNIMNKISKISNEFITWSSKEYSFIQLPDEYTSTSSIMPQKKNPDILELIRAKSSKIIGNLTSISSILNSNPRAYNRDLQEINPIVWESIEITKKSTLLLRKIIEKTCFNQEKIKESFENDQSNASELANELVRRKGLSFREAHNKVSSKINKKKSIKEIAKQYNIPIEELEENKIIEKKDNTGSPKKERISENIQNQKTRLSKRKKETKKLKEKKQKSYKKLDKEIKKLLGKND